MGMFDKLKQLLGGSSDEPTKGVGLDLRNDPEAQWGMDLRQNDIDPPHKLQSRSDYDFSQQDIDPDGTDYSDPKEKAKWDKWAEENQIDMHNPNVDEGWNGHSLDLRSPEERDAAFEKKRLAQGKFKPDAEFGGGKFGGHGASGSWGDVPEKVKAKVKSLRQAEAPAEETDTSKPITAGIDKIFAAYRNGDKKLVEAGVKGKSETPDSGQKKDARAEIEKAFNERTLRTDGMKYESDKKYDPTADFAAIDHGAAIASGVKWDPSDHQMRAEANKNREKNRLEEFDRNYRTAHDADTFDERNAERDEQRAFRKDESDLNRAQQLLMMREKAKDSAERAAADRALREEIANGNNALRAEMIRMRHEDSNKDRELKRELQGDKEFEKNVQKAGKDLEPVSRMRPDLDILREQVDNYDHGKSMDGFGVWDSTKPDILDSKADSQVRQGSLRNVAKIILENSGKVATEAEVERTLKSYGLGGMTRERTAAQGIKAMLRDAEASSALRSGKYQPEVLKALEERSGGTYSALNPDGSEIKPSRMAQQPSGLTPEQEAHFQELDKKYGGR